MPSEASTQTSNSSEDECSSTPSVEYSDSTRSSGDNETSTSGSESSSYESSSSSRSSSSGSSSSRSSSSRSSSSEESSSSESSSDESSDAAEFEAGRNERLRRRFLHGLTSSPVVLDADEAENPETSWVMTKGNGQVEEAVSVEDLDVGNLDISSIQDEFNAGLDESNLGFQQPSARGQAYLCETPETSYEFNDTG